MAASDDCFHPEQRDDGDAFVVWDSGRLHDKDGTLLIK